MPTGYTAELCQNEIPFEKFIWRCARAFGPLVTMQDSASDARIPDKFEASNYHLEELSRLNTEMARVVALTDTQLEDQALIEYEKLKAEIETSKERTKVVRERLIRMLIKVAEWIPPTSEHQGLKDFMLEQLDTTIKHDGTFVAMPIQRHSGPEWAKETMAMLKYRIDWCTKEHKKEIERTNERNQWLADLRANVSYGELA